MGSSGGEQLMLVEDQEEKPVTFAEALRNSAIRNVLLNNVQLSAALNPSVKEQLGVHFIGMALSVCAGAANAIAFAKFKMYVSHVSGSSTAIGLRMEDQQPGDVPTPVELVVYFIVGSVLAGLIIPGTTMKLGQGRYEVVLFSVAAMELVCWWHELRYPEMLAAAMGLQNAMITSWSGAVLRTTHMTGTATDLGSALGRIISRFCRRGCRLSNYTDEDWDQHVVDRKKLILMICLLLSFISGGVVGAAGFGVLGLHALLIPATVTAILGGIHVAYCVMNREELFVEKAAEEHFARQLSGGSGVQGDVAFAEDTQKAEMFIRQISGASGKPDRMEHFVRQISGAAGRADGKMATIPEQQVGA